MKTLLRNLFNRNPKLRDLIMAMISSSKEAIAIYDHQGDLIFGNGYLNQQTPKEIYLNGLSIGSVYGGSAAFQICDVIQLFVDQQDIQKKLGAETLQMYREINLLFAFAGKLSQITDVESIAQLAIEEVENVIQFERGVIFLGENIKDIK
ncbi:MAG: hypothetical protein KDC53_00200, partial [Saprospiraceae bacterium]|nr:hypothetical protein [Saprospiraceae bacterium]